MRKGIWDAAMRKNIEAAAIQFLEEAEHDVKKSDRALEEDEDHADCDSADRGVTCRQTGYPRLQRHLATCDLWLCQGGWF